MHTRPIKLLFSTVVILMAACQPLIPATPPPVPTGTNGPDRTPSGTVDPTQTPVFTLTEYNLPVGFAASGPWIDIYFTNPDSPLAGQETGGIDGQLVAALDAARLSVDVAVYSLSLRSISDALIRAHDRGVQVRVVMESDNRDRSAPRDLTEAGITVLGDRREGLMHNKFVVIDRSEVWLGSMNFTTGGTYHDNNNLIRLRSVKIAENYTQEFNEMFVDDQFGPDIVAATPNPVVTLDGTVVEVLFSPDDGIADKLLELLQNAYASIYFMAYSFTTDEFGEAIRSQAQNGLTVAGVMDEEQIRSNIGTEYDPFKQAELDVFPDGLDGLMHHKVFIIDGEIVVTGSYNFSRSADTRNDENLVIFYNKKIAEFFMKEFNRVYALAQK